MGSLVFAFSNYRPQHDAPSFVEIINGPENAESPFHDVLPQADPGFDPPEKAEKGALEERDLRYHSTKFSNKTLSVENSCESQSDLEFTKPAAKPGGLLDEYSHSKAIFDCVNDMRMNPTRYLDYLTEFISDVETDEEVAFIDLSRFPKYSLLPHQRKYQLTHGIESLYRLKDFLQLLDTSADPILWSEGTYGRCLVEIANMNMPGICYSDDEEEGSTVRGQLSFTNKVEKSLTGAFNPILTALLMLSEETNNVKELILCEVHETGAVHFTMSDEDFKQGICMMILGSRKSMEQRLLEVPRLRLDNENEIDLSHEIFSGLDYKESIVDGSFVVENGLFIASFKMEDGSTRVERSVIC